MSYDVYVVDKETDEPLEFQHPQHFRGGNYAVGGTTEAWLNITYNYSGHYYGVWGYSINDFHGQPTLDVIPKLVEAIKVLGSERDDNYWASTPGNAGAALVDLMGLISQFPNGKLDVS